LERPPRSGSDRRNLELTNPSLRDDECGIDCADGYFAAGAFLELLTDSDAVGLFAEMQEGGEDDELESAR